MCGFGGDCSRIGYIVLEGMGAYGPLLLAPAEGPLASGGNLF